MPDIIETVAPLYVSPHCDLDLEHSKLSCRMSHNKYITDTRGCFLFEPEVFFIHSLA